MPLKKLLSLEPELKFIEELPEILGPAAELFCCHHSARVEAPLHSVARIHQPNPGPVKSHSVRQAAAARVKVTRQRQTAHQLESGRAARANDEDPAAVSTEVH